MFLFVSQLLPGIQRHNAKRLCSFTNRKLFGYRYYFNGCREWGYSKRLHCQDRGRTSLFLLLTRTQNYTGKFYRISGNSGDQVTIENPLNDSLQDIFSPDSEIEIFEAWTLGELLGYESTSLNYIDPITGAVTYDYLYLLTPPLVKMEMLVTLRFFP